MLLTIKEINKNLLFSPASDEGDTRPADIFSFYPKDYPELTQELNEFSKELYYKDDHRLVKNYTFLDFDDFDVVSVWKRNNKIVGFATAYNRDFYPTNSIRILNRFYHDKSYSRIKFTRELLRPSTFHCVQQQLLLVAKLGYSEAFISREMRAVKFFSKFIEALNDRSTHKWEYNQGPFLVSPNASDEKSWQSIGLVKFNNNYNNFWEHWKCKQH